VADEIVKDILADAKLLETHELEKPCEEIPPQGFFILIGNKHMTKSSCISYAESLY
jgi:hypothetical protein